LVGFRPIQTGKVEDEMTSLKTLFDRVLAEGAREVTGHGDRTPEASYTRGFRDEITTATLELGGYQVVATQVGWLTMEPAADKNGTRYALKVCQGDKVVFEATREGASASTNFGEEERYTGTDTTPAGEWVVVQGELPKELELVPA